MPLLPVLTTYRILQPLHIPPVSGALDDCVAGGKQAGAAQPGPARDAAD